jgi:PAS domain S-box-containing protein
MSKATIMIVEDEWVIADDLRNSLEGLNYTVSSVVASGEEAVVKAEKERPDLVLMDTVLSGTMDGIEAAERIRSRFNIPHIFITAYGDERILERAKVTNPLGYLLKPFDDKELNATIELALYKHKMEKKLRESEAKYRLLLTSVSAGWAFHKIIVDEENRPVDYVFLEVNEAFEKLTGLKKEYIVGKRVTEVLPGTEHDPADWIGRFGEVALTGKATKFENYSEVIDKWYSVSASSHERGYFIVLFDDITRRKQYEAKLKESEERFQGAFQYSAVGMGLVTTEGKWMRVNEALCKIVGYSEEELLSLSFQDITYPDDLDGDLKYVRQMLNGERSNYNMEKRYIRKDGQIVWVLLSVSLVRDLHGEPVHFVSQVQDITERKKSERYLQEAHERLLTILDSIESLIYVADMESYELLFVNKYGRDIWGDISGQTCWKVLQSGQTQPCEFCTNKYLLDPEGRPTGTYAWEFQNTANGRWYFIRDRAVRWFDGRIVRLEIASDITERKTAELEREHLTTKLEHKNKEMEQLVYVTSHDLRTPLAIVQGYAKELEMTMNQIVTEIEHEKMSPHVNKKLNSYANDIQETNKYIRSNIQKMDALLYGLLKLSRSGNVEINIGPLDMNKLAGDVKRSLDFKIREAGASIEISELPSGIGDETQINQVFSNLLGNALKYLDPERPGIIMMSGNREGSESIYCVEDNGVGIESSERDRIFNIFYQGHSSAAGEGLGLTIVSKILERHDGRIWIESEPGRGSRFYVALPGGGTLSGTGENGT